MKYRIVMEVESADGLDKPDAAELLKQELNDCYFNMGGDNITGLTLEKLAD